jgi:RNA polymerase sigma-70 factor (ECF subfamily)
VFLAVWQNLAEFQRDPPRWTFRKWLRTITRNKIIDCWHKEGARSGKAEGGSEAQTRLAELPADEEEEEGRISEETGFLYQRALQLIESSFQPGTIQAFLLYAVEGLAVETVAQRLQISVNTVYLARSRVAKKIRTEFGDVLEVETPLQPPAQKSSQDIVP